MNKIFQQVQSRRPKSNAFDLSHERKMSMNMGELVPILVQEVIPGDRFKVNVESMMRLAPMIAPVMHRINVFTHFFFVPNRLVYDEWKEFITGGEDGHSSPAFPKINIEQATAAAMGKGSLADYMGIPTVPETVDQPTTVSALPFRAYATIFNEYYRDQNIEPELEITKDSVMTSTEQAILLQMRQRPWEKDYLTSALPWAQRGGEVQVPMDGTISPEYKAVSEVYDENGNLLDGNISALNTEMQIEGGTTIKGRIENLSDDLDLTSAGITINDLRKATRLQQWLEKNARGGSRYIEQILAHFGVRSSDARLQRPEYLGGGKNPIVISETLSTYGGTPEGQPEVPQGNMAGHGIGIGKSHNFRKSFEEHGYIIGIISVLPRTAYHQGINRNWKKYDKFDYFWPEFANLGEQPVLNSEVYTSFKSGEEPNSTFGYQSRYAEYKFKESTVHGDFKNMEAGGLGYWTMSRDFDQEQNLNADFIKSDPTHRIFAVEDTEIHKLYVQLYCNIRAIRLMPQFGTPTL